VAVIDRLAERNRLMEPFDFASMIDADDRFNVQSWTTKQGAETLVLADEVALTIETNQDGHLIWWLFNTDSGPADSFAEGLVDTGEFGIDDIAEHLPA
jgi:hypothetical protein